MNLSPRWCDTLTASGWEAVHWSTIGPHNAPDAVIMRWARAHQYLVFTHDLDFGALLAEARDSGPSIVLLRFQVPTPELCAGMVVNAITAHHEDLSRGAFLVIDELTSRIRVLPFA
jgi:predicted nuclease of predicted toxin-antitoxin system